VGTGGKARRYMGSMEYILDLADGLDNYAAWGSSSNDVWVVGQQGRIAHRTANSWTIAVPGQIGAPTLRSMSGNGPSNILTVGDMGTVRHYDGTTWQTLQSGTTRQLFAVFMLANGTAWITGDGSTTGGSTVLLHYDPN
jgi:hypothetical protein